VWKIYISLIDLAAKVLEIKRLTPKIQDESHDDFVR
jgi:hypothetical protein